MASAGLGERAGGAVLQAGSPRGAAEHVVILGGGFGGWYAARHLAAILPMEHQITLVDRVDHMLYTPMLTEAAGGTVPPQSIAVSFSSLSKRVRVVRGEIDTVDVHAKTVRMAAGEEILATQLVLALGSTTAYHEIPGAEEHSFPLKTLEQADTIRDKMDALIAETATAAKTGGDGEKFTLVVAGGGYTGVESVAALNERMHEQAKLCGLRPEQVSATIVESSKRLMAEMPEGLAEYSHKTIEADGIRVMLGTSIKEVMPGKVQLSDGEELPASLLLWDTGIEPSGLLAKVDVPKGKHHGVVVDNCFQVEGRPGVWAIGDCAEVPMPDGKGSYAPTAQNASREGVQVARNIVAQVKGRKLHPFRFVMLGQLALVSKKDAVADILGVELRGLLAWGMWWAVYILKLPNIALRIRVLGALMLGEGQGAEGGRS